MDLKQEIAQMPDDQFALLCYGEVFSLVQTAGQSFEVSVPRKVTDSDVLLAELVDRFIARIKADYEKNDVSRHVGRRKEKEG